MRSLPLTIILPALILTGCHVRDNSSSNVTSTNSADLNASQDIDMGLNNIDATDNVAAEPMPGNDALSMANGSAEQNMAQPAPTPSPSPAAGDYTSSTAALDVVRSYYSAITAGNYAKARAQWADGGDASDKSPADFAKQFDKYSSFQADIGEPGMVDAATESRTIRIPVTLHGTLRGGASAFRTKATVVLKRAADIKGPSEAEKHWHITQIEKPQGSGS